MIAERSEREATKVVVTEGRCMMQVPLDVVCEEYVIYVYMVNVELTSE